MTNGIKENYTLDVRMPINIYDPEDLSKAVKENIISSVGECISKFYTTHNCYPTTIVMNGMDKCQLTGALSDNCGVRYRCSEPYVFPIDDDRGILLLDGCTTKHGVVSLMHWEDAKFQQVEWYESFKLLPTELCSTSSHLDVVYSKLDNLVEYIEEHPENCTCEVGELQGITWILRNIYNIVRE